MQFIFNTDDLYLATAPNPLSCTLADIEHFFCFNEHRKQIFEQYKCYCYDLQNTLNANFYQYVDGSFISKKEHPNDIDVVSFAPTQGSTQDAKLTKFTPFEGVKEKYGDVVDAYLVFTGTKITTEQDIFWKKQFSQDKNQTKKNFILVHIPFL